jgi:Polyketide cyclase / dehydrase and lipid transport
MKILKKILIVIAVLIAIIAITGMFMSPKVHVERSMEMNAAPEAVYSQIADLNMWDNWMPWNKIDPEMKKTFGEKTSGEGASYSWESNHGDVGNGMVTITKAVPNELVETALDFKENGMATGSYKIEKTDKGSRVIWSMETDMGANPFLRIMGSMMDMMMGPVFDKGLHSLDSSASAMPPAPLVAPSDSTATNAGDSTAVVSQ